MKAWSGRFEGKMDSLMEEFTESVSFDKRLAIYDITGSVAHCKMLNKIGILSESEIKVIIKGLKEIGESVINGKIKLSTSLEDIHMNIEALLKKKIGDTAYKIHTARSRNDQVILDLTLYLRDVNSNIITGIKEVQKQIVEFSEKNIDIIVPGYTHLQQAQPVLLAHHFMAYYYKMKRDIERFENCQTALEYLPLGTGAMAGLNYKLDRRYVADLLDFKYISQNSMDTVSSRDFVLDFLYACSVFALHLSRFAEDIILLVSEEFGVLDIDDKFTSGSSIMPNKKNPDIAELLRGNTAIVIGNLNSLMLLLKGLPLTYNRDLQIDKKITFETVDIIEGVLAILPAFIKSLNPRKNRKPMNDFMMATDLADYLVKKGIPFRNAHHIIGKIVKYCISKGIGFSELSIQNLRKFCNEFEEDVLKLLNFRTSVELKVSFGGTSTANVKKQIKSAYKFLK